jgi:hypothetical protein
MTGSFLEDDLDDFFIDEDYATTAFSDPDGLRNSFPVLWDNEYLEQDGGYGAGISSRSPVITCKTADADTYLVQDTIIEIDGVRYTVKQPEPDGTGISTVPLFKV